MWFYNIIIGFLVIFSFKKYPEYLVLEIGADRPGDIKRICSWLSPNTGVVTALGEVPVHVEFFPSIDELFAEKSELIRSLPDSGKAILNADDNNVAGMRILVKNRPLFYGFSQRAEVRASNYRHTYDDRNRVSGFVFKIDNNGNSVPFSFRGFLGRQHVYAVLAGVSVGLSEKINMVVIKESLNEYVAQPGRVKILRGKNGSTLLDDSYNASPIAVKSVLSELDEINTEGRKIAVLGDMMALGKYTHDEHRKVSEQAFSVCDVVISVGVRARIITEGVEEEKKESYHFSNSIECADKFPIELREDDVVLIKGSQAVRMEHVTKKLLDESEDAFKMLVRQDDYWKRN